MTRKHRLDNSEISDKKRKKKNEEEIKDNDNVIDGSNPVPQIEKPDLGYLILLLFIIIENSNVKQP